MNKKYLGLIVIIIGIILLVIIAYFLFIYFFFSQPEVEVIQNNSQQAELTTEVNNLTSVDDGDKIKVNTSVATEIGVEDLRKMSASFAERFGSYSNHSNYGNITDLKIFMSKKMQSWADDFVAEAQGEYSGIYYGVTAKAITEEVQSFDDNAGQASILVKTQRRESTGTMGNGTVYYQDIIISFVKENKAWKVDSAVWQ